MKTSKILALILAMAMVFGLLAACGSSEASTSASAAASTTAEAPAAAEEEAPADAAPAEDASAVEPAEGGVAEAETVGDPFDAMKEEYISYPLEGDNSISIWYYIPGYTQYMDSNYNYNAIDAMEAATGVTLEFQEVISSNARELFNLMISSGDMTDLIPAQEYYSNGLTHAYEEDLIIDIAKYVDEYMPNYAGVYACLDETTQQEALSDGMMLAFRTIADGTYSGNGMITRADWLEEQGWEWSGNLISLDEFTEFLRTMHSAYNTPYTYYMYDGTIGMEAAFDTEIPALVADGFMTFVTSTIYREGDVIKSGWVTDGYREYIEWVRMLMEEGVFYEDFLSLDNDRGVVNTAQGAGEVAVWTANADKMEEILGYTDDPDFAVTAVPNVTADPSAEYVWLQDTSLVTTNAGWSISTSCQQVELVCQWMNYFWTYDGWLLANYGVEGESLVYNEAGEPTFDWQTPVTVTGMNAPNAEMAQQLFTAMRFVSFYSDNDRLLPTFPESALAAIDLWTLDGIDERFYPTAVESSFTVDENEDIAEYEGDLLTYCEETCLGFLTGSIELTDETWGEYVATCESMGINEIIAIYQNAYDEYLAGER